MPPSAGGRHLAISDSSGRSELVVKCCPGTFDSGQAGGRSCKRELDPPDTGIMQPPSFELFDERKTHRLALGRGSGQELWSDDEPRTPQLSGEFRETSVARPPTQRRTLLSSAVVTILSLPRAAWRDVRRAQLFTCRHASGNSLTMAWNGR